MRKILYWSPRILGIVFILFLGIFALDVFAPGQSRWYILGAFLMHLLPNYLLLIALVVAWKNELYGGILFLLFGILGTFFFHTYTLLPTFLMIFCPVLLIGVLFLWSHFSERR